jgi:PAS domain S-box-containing protein
MSMMNRTFRKLPKSVVMENSPVILFRWKAAEGWPVAYVSQNVIQLGYSPEELVSGAVPYSAIVHPDDLGRIASEIRKFSADGIDKYRQEYRIITKDKNVRWIEDWKTVWRDEQGTITHFDGVVIDQTEHLRINDEIELLKISVDQAPDELFWLDFEGNILNVNDAACRMTGYPREELLNMKVFEIDPDFSCEIWDRVIAEIRERKTLVFTARQRGKNGVIIDIEIMAVYVKKDNRDYMFTFVRDITARKQTENALRESDKRYRLILQSANDAIFLHEIGETAPGRFIEVNDQACRMLGYTRDELLQMSIPNVFVPEQKERAPGVIKELTLTGKVVFQTEMLTKDGRRIPADVSNRLVELDGRPVVLSIVHDITDLKRNEKALQATNRKLNLLSSITRHDIINQLTLLTGYIRISHGYLDDKKNLVKFLEKADKAAKTIEHHIQFTKEYQELGVHAPAWQNVHEIIIKAMGGLHLGNIKVEVDRTDLEIFADPLCGKVFYNLIDNALRYGGESMKTIRFSSQESGAGLTILCEDDGVGISDEVKKSLFTRGFGKHTGLGLFLSREILAITGITITENGTEGRGARFEITVPKGMYRFSGSETQKEK